MKRGHTVLEYKSIIRRVRAVRPDICVTSDFIVGFPGETEQDFEATMKLIDEIGFDNSFSYLYSPRPGTPAAELRDDTPHEVKVARLKAPSGSRAKSVSPAAILVRLRHLRANCSERRRRRSAFCSRADEAAGHPSARARRERERSGGAGAGP